MSGNIDPRPVPNQREIAPMPFMTSLLKRVKLLGEIAAALVAIAVVVGAIWSFLRPPSFEFMFVGIPQQEEPVYELTEPMFWGSVLGKFQATVNVNVLYPQDIHGPVFVEIVLANNSQVTVAQWDDFQNEHNTRTFYLAPTTLLKYAGLSNKVEGFDPTQKSLPTDRVGKFTLRIVHNTDPLAEKTVTVKNTPWIHSVQLVEDLLYGTGSTTNAFITIKNFGRSAEFYVFGAIRDATSQTPANVESTFQHEWWPSKIWNDPISISRRKTPVISENGEYTIAMPIPGEQFKFQEKHVYVLETFVVKSQRYFQFADGDWFSSDVGTGVHDRSAYSIIIIIQP